MGPEEILVMFFRGLESVVPWFQHMELALMNMSSETLNSRELVLQIRSAVTRPTMAVKMPESEVWGAYVELRRRGEPEADRRFIQALRSLHRRRSDGVANIPLSDTAPREHLEAPDPFLGELFKAYKKCIQNTRLGPAAKLIRDMESQIKAVC